MNNLIKDFERYLKETLDVSVKPIQWTETDRLPFFLRDLYHFYTFSMLDVRYLLMAAREQAEQTPAIVRKRLAQVKKYCNLEVIYLHSLVSAYNRKRLIEHKVPFVVPGNQMYLPVVGVDLREHFRKIRSSGTLFSPSTQTVVLHALFNANDQALTPSGVAARLGYTAMTLTRAFNELEALGLAEVFMQGRERMLRFRWTKKELWENAKEFMRSPVRRRTYIKPPQGNRPGLKAGLTALAHYTMLAQPANPIYAMSTVDLKLLKQRNDVIEINGPMETEISEIEIWSYPPRLFAANDVVDRFSLYLSLCDSEDERVESALEEMMESLLW